MARDKEALECVKECYTLWAMNHLRNPGSMKAALGLIQSCLHNGAYEDAERYARHAHFMIAEMTDNFIPSDEQPWFLAEVSRYLAQAIFRWAQAGGTPSEGKQKAGEEAITFARQALEIDTQLHGTESAAVAVDMAVLADVLDYFNNVDDEEVPHLREQSIAIYRRVEGSSSVNVATGETNLGLAYKNRAMKALYANDLDRCMANFELALPHYREAARIFQTISVGDSADEALRNVPRVEETIRQVEIARAAAAAATRG